MIKDSALYKTITCSRADNTKKSHGINELKVQY